MSRGRKHTNLTGQRFGRLVAVEYLGASAWRCKCDCGNEVIASCRALKGGGTKSCGCYKSSIQTKHGGAKKDGTKERLYNVWQSMKQRCSNPNSASYINYGGRGISVCQEWQNSYSLFREWALQNGYNPYGPRGVCTLDRIDVNGNYEPSNCRFVDSETQSRNTRRSLIFKVDGESLSLKQISIKYNIPYRRLYWHIHRGKSIEDTLDFFKEN